MNDVLCLVRSAHASSSEGADLSSQRMVAELLALHQDMIEQLCLERLEVPDRTDFLTGLIGQHEKAAQMLRMKLETMRLEPAATD